MGMILIFNRKVIPLTKDTAKVETEVVGFLDGEYYDIGHVNFPTKQSWTKFWGALQRGSVGLPDFEVKMQNVPMEDGEPAEPQEVVKEPTKRWVGNVLVPDDPPKA
jgi:hypothetical protein